MEDVDGVGRVARRLKQIPLIDADTRRNLAYPPAEFEGVFLDLVGALETRPALCAPVNFKLSQVEARLHLVARASRSLGKMKNVDRLLSDIQAVTSGR